MNYSKHQVHSLHPTPELNQLPEDIPRSLRVASTKTSSNKKKAISNTSLSTSIDNKKTPMHPYPSVWYSKFFGVFSLTLLSFSY
ncbi:hypothetical protein G7K_5626-t1 [Saitoella complicata NRRL Y-17804]|uniref:Uncharacterized protein n=1 Tax=Saitoella complicata (strain BCRC 22490 / CBS 7301 / JCM 7358 / NBRC 10748 / NRRL Y-17804) TaxID=698492 RepID=A0A0E9NNS3_SAICN|nr:hypothetical protein G7K_5626-t1 [Saitoella complicata NRRL Y-17804]